MKISVKRVKELYIFRELLSNLVIKELKLKYRNSVLGFVWSLLNPLLTMLVFTFFIGFVFKPGIKNFPVFLLCGLLPWNFFNGSLQTATASIVSNAGLIKKVYFPREILTIAPVLANLINFLLELLVLFVFLAFYGYHFYLFIPWVLVLLVVETILIIGISLGLSALNVYFRDIQYIMSVLLLAVFYATPILYNITMIEKVGLISRNPWILTLYKANPMTSLVIQFHSVLYEGVFPPLQYVVYAIVSALVALVVGYVIFLRFEPNFAEEV